MRTLRRLVAGRAHPSMPLAVALTLVVVTATSAVVTLPTAASAQDSGGADAEALNLALGSLEFREIGPAIMGGRVADIAAVEGNSSIFYVGFATGGLWKTTNQGMTFEPLFDHQPVSSIGEVTIAPSNPNVIWVGTGEPQNRQSSPYGNGIYRSVDGGRTWLHVGLTETRHIARIRVHPRNPDVAYVAAVGHLWGPNEQRGVFKTTDGGATWEKVLYIDENTGAIDLAMHPGDPNTLFAAMYQRRRTPWGFSASGSGSGLYRTLDGGDTWEELTDGLPEGEKGRMGIDIYRRNGDIVYITVESDDDGRGVYRSTDRGETWQKMSDRNPRPMYFSLIRIDPNDPERIYLGGVAFSISDDGGRTWREGDQAEGTHVDHHALWIDPNDSDHLILGNDGGVSSSFDRGASWRHHNVMALGQLYQVDVGPGDPYRICGGLQDNYSWCGSNQTLYERGIMNRDWIAVHGGDGFWNVIDPSDPNIVYTESQNGRVSRYHADTGEEASVQPVPRPTPEDTASEYRWNWNTPIHISHHDPATVYVGANHLLRSRDRAVTWEEISPDLTRDIDRDTLQIMGVLTDSTTLSRHDGVSDYGTIVEIGESPLNANLIYVGTDDGVLQVTRDGGTTWTDITANVPGLGHGMVVSAIEPSHHIADRVYLAFDGHWSDDYRPHAFVSEDAGESWTQITTGLPEDASVNTLREHPGTPELLFLGNEVGLYASLDRGATWIRFHGGARAEETSTEGDADGESRRSARPRRLPTVPVDDIRIQSTTNDLVVATHGRSIWIVDDITPLEQIARQPLLASAVHLFPVRDATMWARKGRYDFWGDAVFRAPNPPDGAVIRYWLRENLTPPDAAPVVTAEGGTSGRVRPRPAGRRGPEVSGADGPRARGSSKHHAERFDGAGVARPANAAAAVEGGSDAAPGARAADSAAVQLEILDADGEVVRTLEGPDRAGLQRVVWDFRMDPPYEPEPDEDEEEGGRDWDSEGPDGPLVLPGNYVARLSAAGETLTTDIAVQQDPRIEVPREVLVARQQAVLRLHVLAKPMYEAEQAAEKAAERIEAAKEVLEQSGGEVQTLLAEADSLAQRFEEASDALDEADAGGVRGDIEDISARPTADQLWQIEQAWEEGPEAIRALNELLTGDFAAFEAKVYQPAALPEALGPIEVPAPPVARGGA